MEALIINYSLKKTNEGERSKIQRNLYGYKDHSNRGSYTYQRKGILDKLLHKKIDQRVILILKKDKNIIIPIFKENNAEVEIIPISIAPSFLKKK